VLRAANGRKRRGLRDPRRPAAFPARGIHSRKVFMSSDPNRHPRERENIDVERLRPGEKRAVGTMP
jgi:hypothetical protein